MPPETEWHAIHRKPNMTAQRQVQTVCWFMYGKQRAYFAQRTKLRRILIAASRCCKNYENDAPDANLKTFT